MSSNSCPICYNKVRKPIEIKKEIASAYNIKNDQVTYAVTKVCRHVFCRNCLEHWINELTKKSLPFSCPCCRAIFNPSATTDSKTRSACEKNLAALSKEAQRECFEELISTGNHQIVAQIIITKKFYEQIDDLICKLKESDKEKLLDQIEKIINAMQDIYEKIDMLEQLIIVFLNNNNLIEAARFTNLISNQSKQLDLMARVGETYCKSLL